MGCYPEIIKYYKMLRQNGNRQSILYLLAFIFLIIQPACTRKLTEEAIPPVDLIPQEQMVDIILDLHVYDAIMNSMKRKPKKIQNEERFYLYNSVIEKHKITREQFKASFKYYQEDIEVMDQIYEEVEKKLNIMKSEIEKTD